MSGADDPDRITELFSGFAPVAVRRMFSGSGVFADGLMIALVVDGVIYLKADDSLVPLFEREAPGGWHVTLDGNENFHDFGAFRAFWEDARAGAGPELEQSQRPSGCLRHKTKGADERFGP